MTINEKYQQARKSGALVPPESQNPAETSTPIAEPRHDSAPKSSSQGKGLIYFLVVFASILLLAAISCPKEAEHRVAVTPAVTRMVEYQYCHYLDDVDIEEVKKDDLGRILLNAMVDKPVKNIMNNFFVSNHIVYSIGYVSVQDKSMRVSIGCFGHVFVLDKFDESYVSEWDFVHSLIDLSHF